MKQISQSRKFLFARARQWCLLSTIVMVVVTAITVRPLPNTPYLNLAAMEEISAFRASFENETQSLPPQHLISAGFARVDLISHPSEDGALRSSDPGLPLAGYGERNGNPITGILDPVSVTSIFLKSQSHGFLIIAMDVLIIPRDFHDQIVPIIEKEFQIPGQNIYMSASHTHSSYGGWAQSFVGKKFAGDYNSQVLEWWKSSLLNAIRQSIENQSTVISSQAYYQSVPNIIRNRLSPETGTVFHVLQGSVIERSNASSIILGIFSAHPTILPGDSFLLSSDYPGAWRDTLESAGNYSAAFLAGSMGSHAPAFDSFPDSTSAPSIRVKQIGDQLAAATLTAIKTPDKNSFSQSPPINAKKINLSVPQPQLRLTSNLMLSPWITRQLTDPPTDTFINSLRIGNLLLISMPGDFSGELASRFFYSKIHSDHGQKLIPAITSFNGDYTGYILPAKYYFQNAYESQIMNFFGIAWSEICVQSAHALYDFHHISIQ